MPLSFDRQAQIAFKNLLGKSQVQKNFGVGNESYGYFFNVPSSNVWSSKIPSNDPDTAVSNQIAVQIVADLTNISDSASSGQFLAYETIWPTTIQILGDVKDPKTNQPFQYGVGSLKDITAGTKIIDLVPDSYGLKYGVKIYTSYPSAQISPGDPREWVFQYSSGILYQDIVTSGGYAAPTKVVGYFYIGNKLSSLDSTGPEIIRVSATGPDVSLSYYATVSTPFISTYSLNHLYLIDFAYGNTSSVKLNIDYIGTSSVYKYGLTGLNELSSGDIRGGTGSTAGPLYYLTWNTDGYFLFFESNPGQTPGLFKDETPTINTVGGIDKGSSFNEVTLQNMFLDLLYPEKLANLTSLNFTHSNVSSGNDLQNKFIDIGRSLTGTLTFSWMFSNGGDFGATSVTIADVTPVSTPTNNWPAPRPANLTYNYTDLTGTFSYTQSIVSNTPDKRIFSISGLRKNNTTVRKYGEIIWTWRGYFGSSTYSTLTAGGVPNLGGQLMTYSLGSFNISGTQGYKYLAFPESTDYNFKSISYFGLPVVLATNSYTSVDSNGNNFATLSVTNSYSRNTTYKIYRTLNQISGTLSVNITN
jgi:hypothetical protein